MCGFRGSSGSLLAVAASLHVGHHDLGNQTLNRTKVSSLRHLLEVDSMSSRCPRQEGFSRRFLTLRVSH